MPKRSATNKKWRKQGKGHRQFDEPQNSEFPLLPEHNPSRSTESTRQDSTHAPAYQSTELKPLPFTHSLSNVVAGLDDWLTTRVVS